MASAPRQWVHRGTVAAAALLFDPGLLGEDEARARVLVLWTPGTTVYQLPDGSYLLRLARPRWLRAQDALGLPLVQQGAWLTSLPAVLPVADGGVAVGCSGELVTYAPQQLTVVDPARWLTLTGLTAIPTVSLGTPPQRATDAVPPLETPDLREKLGVSPADPQADAVRQLLLHGPTDEPGPPQEAPQKPGWGQRLRDWAKKAMGGDMALTGDALSLGPDLDALRRQLAEWILQSGLGSAVERQHQQYLDRMMTHFARGEWDEALKRAIPLGKDDDPPPTSLWLGPLTPRDDIQLRTQAETPGSGIPLQGGWEQQLKQLYRRAFERMEADGKIEEAAFLLADVLRENQEAVAFLEKHRRYQLAAELAEGRQLPPDWIVRQWWLAGNKTRAIAVARRFNAFADAVIRLEKTDPEQGKLLRLEWAGWRARSGDYAGAVQTALLVPEAAGILREWAERAAEQGGVVGARMRAYQLALAQTPDERRLVQSKVGELLSAPGTELAAERLAFAEALVSSHLPSCPPETLIRSAQDAVRALLRLAGHGQKVDRTTLNRLVTLADDPALKADLPTLPALPAPLPPLAQRHTCTEHRIGSDAVGSATVRDAVVLPSGRVLVALGEGGVHLLSRDGRTLMHWDQPAEHLVFSDHGDKALLVARRGESVRVARLDLVSWKAELWVTLLCSAFASTFDGSLWFVGMGEDLVALDATASHLTALWRVPELPGPVIALERDPTQLTALVAGGEGATLYTYQVPDLTLLRQQPFDITFDSVAVAPDGTGVELQPYGTISYFGSAVDFQEFATLTLRKGAALRRGELVEGEGSPLSLETDGVAVIVALGNPTGSDVLVFAAARLDPMPGGTISPLLRVTLAGASAVTVRLQAKSWVVADDQGRVVLVDPETGDLQRTLLVRV